LGSGWSGNLFNAGFRGELSYVVPYKDSSAYAHSMDNLFMGAVSFDYSFANSAYALAEMLYSNNDVSAMSNSFQSAFSSPMTIRNLAFSRFSFLASVTYPLHPLVNAGMASMLFYGINGFYLGPNIDISITDNLGLSTFWQYFNMQLSKEKQIGMDNMAINYLYFRLKYNF
jgi:hypothetical protein